MTGPSDPTFVSTRTPSQRPLCVALRCAQIARGLVPVPSVVQHLRCVRTAPEGTVELVLVLCGLLLHRSVPLLESIPCVETAAAGSNVIGLLLRTPLAWRPRRTPRRTA